mmetsp:Transcript_28466/g.72120  ORF Transcript_28466/g.72120 Transcript_28466/m.72120 type:complete len:385 (-) Transcript_28466:67-1221(-)
MWQLRRAAAPRAISEVTRCLSLEGTTSVALAHAGCKPSSISAPSWRRPCPWRPLAVTSSPPYHSLWAQRRSASTHSEAIAHLTEAALDPQAMHDFIAQAPPEVRRVVATESFRALSGETVEDVEAFMASLTHQEARTLGLAALTRHFGGDFKAQFEAADQDNSGTLSKAEFKRYVCTLATTHANLHVEQPGTRQLVIFSLNSAIPFVVFGFFDNSIMILGGDVVDDLIGSTFQLSTLACAAVANTFADVFGISIGNTVEAMTVRLGLPQAHLSAAQAALPLVRRIGLASGSFGILIGCIMGMAPLLFMDQDRKALKEQFSKADTEHTGALQVHVLMKVIDRAGFEKVEEAPLRALLQELGILKDGTVSVKDFLDNSKKFVGAFS